MIGPKLRLAFDAALAARGERYRAVEARLRSGVWGAEELQAGQEDPDPEHRARDDREAAERADHARGRLAHLALASLSGHLPRGPRCSPVT